MLSIEKTCFCRINFVDKNKFRRNVSFMKLPLKQIELKETYVSLHKVSLCIPCFRAGVSNTRPAGRMWPAMGINAARDSL